jgi:hypothetical protein
LRNLEFKEVGDMSADRDDQFRNLADEESELQALEREKKAIESRPHDGFADAARVVRLESEIEALDERIEREKQRAERGEG